MYKALTKPSFNEKYKYKTITTVYENGEVVEREADINE